MEKTFEVYTYNRSQVFLVDEEYQYETSIDTTFNYDTKEEEWVESKSGFESVEFSCDAFGGRPRPQFVWYIENNDNDDLESDNHFHISTASMGSDYKYIENFRSTIEFGIDHTLMERLQKYYQY